MTVKIIAVDMDGTFLNNDKKYNKTRFLQQYQQLKQRGIHFVVASGNQYATLQHYFPEIKDEIAFVAENGAYVIDANQEVAFAHFPKKLVNSMQQQLVQLYRGSVILCGKNGAYIDANVPKENLEKLAKYFKQLQQVTDFSGVDDQICKITLDTRNFDFEPMYQRLEQLDFIVQGHVKMVSSGFGFIDFIVPNQHKANGLKQLQQRWNVSNQQILAIGDNFNDLEMLQHAGFGFAVANAVDELKQAADFVTLKTNEEEAVLDVIDQVLHATFPFNKAQQKSA
ncbi:Cof-type HAD-IIB family hydrolase [Acinetobacter sp. MD2(2019)]|uniref:Cof-type HAD-IIB family hydrolase n=1 Tax=Acinetobacter sp. MD2(2019) TaxID=2605273 RepID=UPI002D1EF662|nr:Cof-type HAD-IIB family hydrolase [Acinetobacter sp. MD2(2019)]MEB3753535.1 HAD family hydrolase [Acinetobacter sp. MD2(2019)]